MYDTIAGYKLINKLSCTEKNNIVYLLNHASEIKNEFGEAITGIYKGLKIRITDNRINIVGSLSKYALGDNLKTISRNNAMESIESLSEAFKIDLGVMKLTRIDVANNFIMKYPTEIYYNKLGVLKYFDRVPFDNGLAYRNYKQELLLYGKLIEMKSKGLPIPEIWKDLNVLRIEYRLKTRIEQTLNVNQVLFSDLYCEVFYLNLLNRWAETYYKVQKLNDVKMKPTKSVKDFEQQLALVGINSIGHDKCIEYIKEMQLKNEINKKQAFEMRNKVRALNQLESASEESELIKELDSKVKDSIMYFR